MRRRFATVLMLGMIAVMVPSGRAAAQQNDVPIDHIIVFYQENHTFDNLYGEFPGANGLNAPGAQVTQVNKIGLPYLTLPQPRNDGDPPCAPCHRAPTGASRMTCPTLRS
jgi:phospholipase C